MKHALLALLLAVSASVGAQCVTSYYPVSTDAGTISVTTGTFPNNTNVTAAYGMWNNTCPASGTGFPHFNQSTTADIDIHIDLRGASTNGGCGFFDHILNGQNQVVGGTVVVFQYIPATASQPQIDCSSDYTQIIAHELGHVLGLGNSSCDGYLMAPAHTRYKADGTLEQYPTRSIKSSECFGANKQWLMAPPDGSEASPPEPEPSTEPPNNCWNCFGDTPILIDLDDASYRLTGIEDGVRFDLNAIGTRDAVSWTSPGRHIAFLARDVDHDGSISSGSELFGSATMLRNGTHAANGFEALREADDDRDGWIDVHDALWQDLLLWEDLNHDGVSQTSELTPIAISRVTAISLTYRWSGRHDKYGNQLRYQSLVRLTEGRRVIYDVTLTRATE